MCGLWCAVVVVVCVVVLDLLRGSLEAGREKGGKRNDEILKAQLVCLQPTGGNKEEEEEEEEEERGGGRGRRNALWDKTRSF